MKLTNIALSTIAAALMMSSVVHAETTTLTGGTIHFTGSLVNAACAVSTESEDMTVNLGQYRTASFSAAGDTSTNIPFTISLTDCDTSVATTAAVAFSGQVDATNPDLLAVSSSSNSASATGVGIEILDGQSSPVPADGATFSNAYALIDGDNDLKFSAHYMATSATVTAGEANADATFIMQYE